MTIDEAIEREKRIADAQKSLYEICTLKEQNQHFIKGQECHEQLAEWLEELKAKRKMLNFLFEVINPNDMEDYMRIYNSTDAKVDGGKK